MQNELSKKLHFLREKYFPGKSLRAVAASLNLGINFYTYLSKIEQGTALPSPQKLLEISEKYGLGENEIKELFDALVVDKTHHKISTMFTAARTQSIPTNPVTAVYRKIKAKNDEDKPPSKLELNK